MRLALYLWLLPAIAAADGFTLNAQEYFEHPGINVELAQVG